MNPVTGGAAIVFMCIVILCIVALRRKADFLLNFLLRSITGMIAIFLINQFLSSQNLSVMVGINPWTALTSGILGFPGVALLYGIHLFHFL